MATFSNRMVIHEESCALQSRGLTARRLVVTGCSCVQLLLGGMLNMGHVSRASSRVTAGDLVFCVSGLWVDCSGPGS